MIVWMEKRADGTIVPSTEMDEQRMKRFKVDTGFRADIKEIRNYGNWKRFRVFINTILENQDKYTNEKDLLVEMKIRVGHYRTHIKHDGEVVYIPKSFSFDDVEEKDFRDIFSKCIQVGIDMVCDGKPVDQEQYFMDMMLRFS